MYKYSEVQSGTMGSNGVWNMEVPLYTDITVHLHVQYIGKREAGCITCISTVNMFPMTSTSFVSIKGLRLDSLNKRQRASSNRNES